MLFKFKKLAMCAAVSMTLASTISGCSNEANTKLVNEGVAGDGDSRPEVKSYDTQLNVSVIDAATGAPINNSTVTLTVTHGSGSFTTSKEDANLGLASFNFANTVTDSDESTVTVAVKAAAAEYLASSQSLTISSTGAASLVIRLLSLSENADLPTGVGIKVVDDKNAEDEITITASSEKGSSVIAIPESTKMTDVEGNEITGGVELVVAHYESAETEALEAFPGGFAVAIENPDAVNDSEAEGAGSLGDDGELTFMSAGFVSVEVVDKDTREKVKNFEAANCVEATNTIDGCVFVTMTIPKGTVNPVTGLAITVNDQIPIWSFDVDTGLWRYEAFSTQNSTIELSGDNWIVKYPVTHLSYWNIDYFAPRSSTCDGTLNIDSNGSSYTDRAKVILSAKGFTQTKDYDGSGTITYNNAPDGAAFTLNFVDIDTQNVFHTEEIADMCDANNTTINVTPPQKIVTKVNLTIETLVKCSNVDGSKASILPTAPYTLYDASSSPRVIVESGSTGENGQVILQNITSSVTVGSSSTPRDYRLYVRDPELSSGWDPEEFTIADSDTTKTFTFGRTCAVSTGSTTGSTGGSSGN